MMRRSLIAGGAVDWVKALHALDNGRRKVPLRDLNRVLDNVAIAQDADAEAREAALRLPRRPLPRLKP